MFHMEVVQQECLDECHSFSGASTKLPCEITISSENMKVFLGTFRTLHLGNC